MQMSLFYALNVVSLKGRLNFLGYKCLYYCIFTYKLIRRFRTIERFPSFYTNLYDKGEVQDGWYEEKKNKKVR